MTDNKASRQRREVKVPPITWPPKSLGNEATPVLDLHTAFQELPIPETCTWYGTVYEGEGKGAKLLPCGEPTIGAGLFCSPNHTLCEYHGLCERHARRRKAETWITKQY